MGFSRKGYWSGLSFPSPGDLPNPGTEPWSPTLQADSLPSESPGKPIYVVANCKISFFFMSEKVGLKLNIQKMKIMASGPITSWEIDGEIVETVSDFLFLGSQITADGDCS